MAKTPTGSSPHRMQYALALSLMSLGMVVPADAYCPVPPPTCSYGYETSCFNYVTCPGSLGYVCTYNCPDGTYYNYQCCS